MTKFIVYCITLKPSFSFLQLISIRFRTNLGYGVTKWCTGNAMCDNMSDSTVNLYQVTQIILNSFESCIKFWRFYTNIGIWIFRHTIYLLNKLEVFIKFLKKIIHLKIEINFFLSHLTVMMTMAFIMSAVMRSSIMMSALMMMLCLPLNSNIFYYLVVLITWRMINCFQSSTITGCVSDVLLSINRQWITSIQKCNWKQKN